jgi:hypothetical protein
MEDKEVPEEKEMSSSNTVSTKSLPHATHNTITIINNK